MQGFSNICAPKSACLLIPFSHKLSEAPLQSVITKHIYLKVHPDPVDSICWDFLLRTIAIGQSAEDVQSAGILLLTDGRWFFLRRHKTVKRTKARPIGRLGNAKDKPHQQIWKPCSQPKRPNQKVTWGLLKPLSPSSHSK